MGSIMRIIEWVVKIILTIVKIILTVSQSGNMVFYDR